MAIDIRKMPGSGLDAVRRRPNQQHQRDATGGRGQRTVVEDRGGTDVVPQQPRDAAGHETDEAYGRAVPTDCARTQALRYKVCRKRLPDGTEDSLKCSVE